jgi:YesN/AraC family two-component response regulator
MSILVVDDEADMEALFRQKFRKEIKEKSFNFHFVTSGELALQFLGSQTAEIVLILSDINMPGMSGLELLKHIKDRFSKLPVIIVSAYGDDSNYKTAMKYGAEDFVTKPIDFEELKKKILEFKK